MSTACTHVKRQRCREAVRDLEPIQYVSDAWIQPPTDGPDGWTIEAVLLHHEIPAVVLETIADAQLRVLPDRTGTRRHPTETRVVARA